MENELELVTSLSEEELEALANSVLAPSAQSRLDTLLEKKSDGLLTTLELSELDALLSQVDQLTILKTRSRFTLQQHAKAAGGVSVHIPAELRRRIRTHFRDHCAYCRTPEALTVVTFEFEHIVPSSLGGETVFQNLCLSCPTCNRYKSDRTVGSSDPATVEFPLFHPHLNDWNEHFEWSSDATVMIGLTQIAQVTIATL